MLTHRQVSQIGLRLSQDYTVVALGHLNSFHNRSLQKQKHYWFA